MSLGQFIQKRSPKPFTINQQILVSLVGVNMLVTVLFSVTLYIKQKAALMADADTTLRAVVTLARETLPADYHDRITGPSSVSDVEFQKIVDRNNRLCVSLGLEYLWSLMAVDGKFVFTTSTSPDKVSANHKHAAFFEPHSNPEFYVSTFESMQPTYRNIADKWGNLRVALIPYTDAHGRKYLFGASYRLTDVERHLRLIVWQVTGIGLALFALSMMVGIGITRRITRPINRLTSTIQRVAAGKRDLVAEEKGSHELVILARQFNRMNRALQDKISGLETETREADEQLMMNERRYQGLLDFAVDGILVGSHEGVISEANERMCALFGMAKSALLGKRINEMPFTSESVLRSPFRFDLIQKGEMVVSERTIRRPDGSEIAVEMHTKMMADGTYQSIYHDITARKRVEDELVTSEQRYRDILNFAVDGILVCCHEGIIIEANERICEFCGISRAELIGHNIKEIPFTPESLRANPLRIDLAEKGETVVNARTLRHRNGAEVVVEMHTKKMPDGNLQSIWYDITSRKQTEAMLVETRRLLDETQSIARVGGWAFDFSTRKAAWTEEVYRIYGVGHDFDINDLERDLSYFASEHVPVLLQALTTGLEQGESFDLECGFIRANGERIWVRVIGRPVMESGKIVKVNGCLMDITERKNAEKALKLKQDELTRQNELMTALLQNLTVGVFMVACPSGTPLVANEAACRLLGRGVLPDADARNLGEIYEAYKGSQRAHRYPVDEMPIMLGMAGVSAHVDDLEVVRPDGQAFRLEIYGTPVKDEQGRVWASLVSFADITERDRMESELRESQSRYRQLFDMESDAIFLIDSGTGHILDVNLAAQTMYGYSREELLARRNVDMSAEPEQTSQITQQAATEGTALFRIALRLHRKKDGLVFPVEIAARSFVMDGRPVHIAAIRDITERERAENELRESQSRYRQLFEMESDAILLAEFESWQFLDVNQAAQDLYGYSREELLLRGPLDLSFEPDSSKSIIMKGMNSDVALLRVPKIMHRKKDGTVFPVEITGRFFMMDGRNVLIMAVRDITQRVKAQELMAEWNAALEKRVAERTAEAERRTGQLQRLTGRLIRAEEDERKRISDVLHEDLQQTLVAARMTLGVAIESVRRLAALEALNQVDGMLSESIKLTRNLVQEIAVPAVKEGDLAVAISWIAQQMQDKFGFKVALTVGEGLVPVSENVYLCLYRAVQEILFNVVKHAHVQQAEVLVGNDEAECVRVTVEDRGCGFSADAFPHAVKREAGVGLQSIRERIEGLGGHIKIVSFAGEGTTVVLTVPAHKGALETGLPVTEFFDTI